MTMRIARLMGIFPSEMEERCTLKDFELLVADYMLDPWGEQRADISRALSGAAMVSAWCEKGIDPVDLMPNFDPPDSEEQQELAKQQFAARVAAWNKALEERGGNRQ